MVNYQCLIMEEQSCQSRDKQEPSGSLITICWSLASLCWDQSCQGHDGGRCLQCIRLGICPRCKHNRAQINMSLCAHTHKLAHCYMPLLNQTHAYTVENTSLIVFRFCLKEYTHNFITVKRANLHYKY